MPLSTSQNTIRGLVAAAALFFVAIGTMGFLYYRLVDLNGWTIHTHKVIEELKDSLSALQDVETGERGFLLTDDRKFQEPFINGMANADKHIKAVQELTIDNPEEQTALTDLVRLSRDKINASKANVSVEEARHAESAKGAEILVQQSGKQVMDEFRVQVAKMIATEEKLLDQRVRDLNNVRSAIWVLTAVLTLIAIFILNWVYQMTQKAIEDEKKRIVELNSEIDQRKRTEKALKDATVKLASSNTDLQQFAYVASHDLQEPLRAVTGFLTLLSNKLGPNLDEDNQRYIKHAVDGAHRMKSLINDLLTYARVESRGKEFEPVDLAKVIQRIEEDLSVAITESSATIVAKNLPTIDGDFSQLCQLFQNLIGNAIKFRSEAPPVIEVKFESQEKEWLGSIKDNGKGFDMEHAERIFVIFQRLQGREQAAGTGIGLALCKKIVERHGGRIWVESAPGKGSTFFFTLQK